MQGSIGIFDSGYGGLTVLKSIRDKLPQYDYIYLGDNARAPYGSRSFDVVYDYTLQAVKFLFELNCPLVILACNTASAKALRSIQQNDLININSDSRVLGVLKPTTEDAGHLTKTGHIGILGTDGTINSNSYRIEINKFFPEVKVTQLSCPMWVPIVENNTFNSEGGEYFIKKKINTILNMDPKIDTLILACTHYPILSAIIKKYIPKGVKLIEQGGLVASKLDKYLDRHTDIHSKLSCNGKLELLTTENNIKFDQQFKIYYNQELYSKTVHY